MIAKNAAMRPTIDASSGAYKRCKGRIVAPGPGRRYPNVVLTSNTIARFVREDPLLEGQEIFWVRVPNAPAHTYTIRQPPDTGL